MDKKNGVFIVFEGIDGCGKSTILPKVARKLKNRDFPILKTREPGGTNCPASEMIRNILLDSLVPLFPKTEAFLFAASRAQHVQNFIIPNLEKGYVIISDRFLWSSLVYQGIGRNLGIPLVSMINAPAVQELSPNIIFLFDLPAEVAQKRIQKQTHDRFEQKGIKFQKKLREAYLHLAKKNSNHTIVIDATCPPDEVAKTIFDEIVTRIPGPECLKEG